MNLAELEFEAVELARPETVAAGAAERDRDQELYGLVEVRIRRLPDLPAIAAEPEVATRWEAAVAEVVRIGRKLEAARQLAQEKRRAGNPSGAAKAEVLAARLEPELLEAKIQAADRRLEVCNSAAHVAGRARLTPEHEEALVEIEDAIRRLQVLKYRLQVGGGNDFRAQRVRVARWREEGRAAREEAADLRFERQERLLQVG